MVDQWCPFAVRRPGHPDKVGYSFAGELNPKRGAVDHSAEGFWHGIHLALDDPNRRASWQFTVGYDRIEQHYPLLANCWHGGDVDDDGGVSANIDLVGKEHLGVAGTPLTPSQVELSTKLDIWIMEQLGRSVWQRFDGWDPDDGKTFLATEHNEVSDAPTACPSGRIPWDEKRRRIEEYFAHPILEDDMTRYKYLQDAGGDHWLVAYMADKDDPDRGFPTWRRPLKHQAGRDYIRSQLGVAQRIGTPGNYTEAQFRTIPIL